MRPAGQVKAVFIWHMQRKVSSKGLADAFLEVESGGSKLGKEGISDTKWGERRKWAGQLAKTGRVSFVGLSYHSGEQIKGGSLLIAFNFFLRSMHYLKK